MRFATLMCFAILAAWVQCPVRAEIPTDCKPSPINRDVAIAACTKYLQRGGPHEIVQSRTVIEPQLYLPKGGTMKRSRMPIDRPKRTLDFMPAISSVAKPIL